ncbi:MAG TPA: XdhC/CoxI family protein [Ktedonobacteraceae bacterium]|jgi:xanthine dehydrogenase accessory factor|nr:XdhC/CoxI family protein [Ktedonobacteraceae bacterium]
MNVTTMYQEIQASLQRGEQVVVATVVKTSGAAPCEVGSKLLVRANGSQYGNVAGPTTDGKIASEAQNALHEGHNYMTHIHMDADQGEAVGSCGATLEVFFEILRPEPRLIIAGAGYVAQALARLAQPLDFRIDVVDDRRDLANPQVFGENVQLIFGDIPETIRNLEPDEESWIVIVTRGHNLDKDALRAALATRAKYIGMIGSPSKVKNIFKEMLKDGVTRERLEQIHAPIGLDLGAETPDEIALSIAAEMVMLRRKGTGAPLNTRHTLLENSVPA